MSQVGAVEVPVCYLGSFPLTVTVTTMGYRSYRNPLNKAPLRTVTRRGNDPNVTVDLQFGNVSQLPIERSLWERMGIPSCFKDLHWCPTLFGRFTKLIRTGTFGVYTGFPLFDSILRNYHLFRKTQHRKDGTTWVASLFVSRTALT